MIPLGAISALESWGSFSEGDGRPDEYAWFMREGYSHYDDLLVYASSRLETSADVEDVVQEAMLLAWKSRGRLADLSGLRRWLFVVVRRRCDDLLRDRTRDEVRSCRLRELLALDSARGVTIPDELLSRAKRRLTAGQRRALEVYLEGAEPSEACARYGWKPNTYYVLRGQAMERIKPWLTN